jgi:1-deoxy-D-xylulose-5-phosphate synthase
MLYTAVQYQDGPIALRYPRGNGIGVPLKSGFDLLEIGKAETVRQGKDVAILALGTVVNASLKAADLLEKDGISAEVVNMRFAKPVDSKLVEDVCKRFRYVLTVEDHVAQGGFGSAVLECIAGLNLEDAVRVKVHGLPDEFVQHGTPAELAAIVKLDAPGIASVVKNFFRDTHKPHAVESHT